MKFVTTVVAAALMVGSASAFQSSAHTIGSQPTHRSTQASRLFAGAQQLTEYMAKAHEEKLRAVKDVEQKKNAEIQNLKEELKSLQSAKALVPASSAATPVLAAPSGTSISEMTKEQLAQQVLSYQQFMAKYIVDSQIQKAKAVSEAEAKIKLQYESKLKLLSASSEVTTTATAPVPAVTSSPSANPAFQQRTAKVAAAAAAGKSRWGDMENKKAGASTVFTVNGTTAPAPVTPLATFGQRTATVAAAGMAGKSRWGGMEVAKAAQAVGVALPESTTPAIMAEPAIPSAVPVTEAVEAADHGLRADGGVSGPSLADRVNLGSQLVGPSASTPLVVGTDISTVYYDQRNAAIAAAGRVGKSRWGEMEVQKAEKLIASLPSSESSAPIKVTKEVEEADHGLRADGGVGGPSLAQRVNLGASMLD